MRHSFNGRTFWLQEINGEVRLMMEFDGFDEGVVAHAGDLAELERDISSTIAALAKMKQQIRT